MKSKKSFKNNKPALKDVNVNVNFQYCRFPTFSNAAVAMKVN